MMYITMFITGFIADLFWTLYIRQIGFGNKFKAALYSVAIGVCSIIMVHGVVSGGLAFIFWLAGLFCGTYYAEQIERASDAAWKAAKNFWRN